MKQDLLVRNNRILAMYNGGMPYSAIAREVGLSSRQVQRVISGRIGGLDSRYGKATALATMRSNIMELLRIVGLNTERCERCSARLYCSYCVIVEADDLVIVCPACVQA